MLKKSTFTVNRRTEIHRRLRAERLEDRRLLATLDLIPAAGAGTISEESGRTVVTVTPGTTVNVTAQVAEAESDVQGLQLNLSGSNSQLAIGNFALGTDFPLAADSTLDSSVDDFFVASALIGQLSVPPPRVFGTFDVTAPTDAGDYLVTSDFTTGSELTNTILSDASGSSLSITDFGDLIVRVEAAALPTVSFSTPSQIVFEDSGSATVELTLSATSTSAVTVPFTVSGTASDVSDYTISTSPVTFSAGAASASITINVIDDGVDESDESVIITLGTPSAGATLGGVTVHTATIRDTVARNASLSGFVYLDFNQNGLREPNERAIPGVIVDLMGTDSRGEAVELRALTADDGSYAFVDLTAGSYDISENHPGAFVDGNDTIGSQGGDTSDDLFEIIDLMANDEGRNNNFGESRLGPGLFSMRFFLASTNFANLYRDLNADAIELAGNPQEADLIRTSGIPSVVSAADESSPSDPAPLTVSIPEQQATVGQEPVRVPASASDPDDDPPRIRLDPLSSPEKAEIVAADSDAEIAADSDAEIGSTPAAQEMEQPVAFPVIAEAEDGPQRLPDSEEFMVPVTNSIASARQLLASAEAEQVSSAAEVTMNHGTSVSSAGADDSKDTEQDSTVNSLLSETSFDQR